MNYKNDISFVLAHELLLYEHQSTVNPNMPLRDLFYVSSVLQGSTRDEDLYGRRMVRIPAPEFVVFYNGTDSQPERLVLRLSNNQPFYKNIDVLGELKKLHMKKYKFDFDPFGLLLFLVVMLPNFIWFAVSAPNDVLRAESATAALDTVASVCQVLMVVALCFIRNQEGERSVSEKTRVTPLIVATLICCLLYFASWAVYYAGIANVPVILGLTVPPCLAFLFYAIGRKNGIAVVPASAFTVCHLIYALVNFI